MYIRAVARVNPSESKEKVKRAVANVLDPEDPEVKVADRGDEVEASGGRQSVVKLFRAFSDKGMLGLLFELINRGKAGDEYVFMLNRQAAYSGQLVLCDDAQESPLGPIYVHIDREAAGLLTSMYREPRRRGGGGERRQEDQGLSLG